MFRMRTGIVAAGLIAVAALVATRVEAQEGRRSGYTYVREVEGLVTVDSRLNGRVDARRNLPISAGDEVFVADGGRLEIGLSDGNLLQVGGGTRVRFTELPQGEEGEESAIELLDGSVILIAYGYEETRIPRVDTEDATVYLRARSRARVNFDPRRGTAVVVRDGTADVRTRTSNETVKAGRYLMVHGEQEPVVEAGSFSRDRFDVWSLDRLEVIYAEGTSASHVGEEYAKDVQSMDGYGDWNYNTTYSSYVWTPRVAVGWTPYSYGSWYYTPLGLSWWSYDPWGWYPHHYGNWFYDASWSRWSWSPGWAYSPAWVYWGYSSGYVGWCPIGWYSYYRPWWNNYYSHWGIPRGGVYLSVHGSYPTRGVDFRGWNFAGDRSIGVVNARMEVTPGERLSGRLGDRVAISSRPLVVEARKGVSTRDAIQEYVREAPRTIERTASRDSERLAPVLARQERLPDATVESLRSRTVVSERGRLAGGTAAEIAPRGAVVDRRSAFEGSRVIAPRAEGSSEGRPVAQAPAQPSSRTVERAPVDRGADPGSTRQSAPAAVEGRKAREVQAPSESRPVERSESWRGRTMRQAAPAESSSDRGSASAPAPSGDRPAPRGSQRSIESTNERPSNQSGDWRSRGDAPAARRVIEGAVPSQERQSQPRSEEFRQRPAPAPRESSERGAARIQAPERAPARESAPAARSAPAPPPAQSAPPPRASSGQSAPPPRASSGQSAPRSAPAPPPASSSGSRPSSGGGSQRSSGRRN